MITGFEEQTKDLTEEEKKLLPGFISGLRTKIGFKNAITSKKIAKAYEATGVKIDGPRIRKIINYIRCRALLPGLIATSKGYYVTTDPKELADYIKSLEERIKSIEMVKRKTQQFLNEQSNC